MIASIRHLQDSRIHKVFNHFLTENRPIAELPKYFFNFHPIAPNSVRRLGRATAKPNSNEPMFFKRFRIDPAIATGPFVTTSIDVFGILFYFMIARIFLF